jgi:hypothetical protein
MLKKNTFFQRKVIVLVIALVFSTQAVLTPVAYSKSQKNDASFFEQVAINSLKQRAFLGEKEAQITLGELIALGKLDEKNNEKKIKWVTRAAEANSTVAQLFLGLLYVNDKNKFPDALKWLTLASNTGNAQAQFNLGLMHEEAEGIKQDLTKAAILYEQSAKQGYPQAQSALANLYGQGKGVEQDYKKAVFWSNEAAKNGVIGSFLALGYAYYQGLGVDQNLETALSYFIIANQMEKNNQKIIDDSSQAISAVQNQLSAESQRRAMEQAKQWIQSNLGQKN